MNRGNRPNSKMEKSSKATFKHEVVGHHENHEESFEHISKVNPHQPTFYNQNNRDVNMNEGEEEAQRFLSEFSDEDTMFGAKRSPLGGELGKENKLYKQKVVTTDAEQDKYEEEKASGPFGRDMNDDDGVY